MGDLELSIDIAFGEFNSMSDRDRAAISGALTECVSNDVYTSLLDYNYDRDFTNETSSCISHAVDKDVAGGFFDYLSGEA